MFKQNMSCSRVSVQVSRLLLLDLRLLLQSVPFSVSRLYRPLLYSLYSLSVKHIIILTRGPWNAHLRQMIFKSSSLFSSLYVQQVTTGRSKSEGLSFASIHNNCLRFDLVCLSFMTHIRTWPRHCQDKHSDQVLIRSQMWSAVLTRIFKDLTW